MKETPITKFPRLTTFLDKYVWDGILEDEPDALAEILNDNNTRTALAEDYLGLNPTLEGVPFPGESENWDRECNKYLGALALAYLVEEWD